MTETTVPATTTPNQAVTTSTGQASAGPASRDPAQSEHGGDSGTPAGAGGGHAAVGRLVADSTPKAPADFVGPVRTVSVNGASLGYRQFGSGRPLLLIMGRNGGMSMWGYALPRALAQAGFAVTMFDNRGVGYSGDDPAQPLTMQLMADDTVALTEALGIARPVVVGWSMGGEIALTAAVRHPGAFGPIVTSGSDAGSEHYVAGDPKDDQILAEPDAAPADMLRILFPDLTDPAVGEFLKGLALYPDPDLTPQTQERQTQAEDAWMDDSSTWDGLGSITGTVVLTNGSKDLLTLMENAHRVGARIPGARTEIFPDLGHAMLFQDIDRFVTLVRTAAG